MNGIFLRFYLKKIYERNYNYNWNCGKGNMSKYMCNIKKKEFLKQKVENPPWSKARERTFITLILTHGTSSILALLQENMVLINFAWTYQAYHSSLHERQKRECMEPLVSRTLGEEDSPCIVFNGVEKIEVQKPTVASLFLAIRILTMVLLLQRFLRLLTIS